MEKEFLALTGECGIMRKTFLMAAFCGEISGDLRFPQNFGILSKNCSRCYRYGFSPNWNDFSQEVGRLNRDLDIISGIRFFTQYLNVTNYMSMWMHSTQQKKPKVHKRHLDQLFLQLRNYTIPDICYHKQVEQYFENPSTHESC